MLTISPARLDFGNQAIGIPSALQTVTVTNISTTDTLQVTDVVPSVGRMFVNANGCAGSIAPGASCPVSVYFNPAAAETYSGTLTFTVADITCGARGGLDCTIKQSIPITGTGIPDPPVMSISPASIDFGDQFVDTAALTDVTITNISATDTISLLGARVSDPALLAGLPGCSSLAPGASCTLAVTFAPTSVGSFSGTVSLDPSVVGCGGCVRSYPEQVVPVTANVTGAVIALSAPPLAFGNFTVGSTTAPRTVWLTNSSKTDTVAIGTIASSDPAFTIDGSACAATLSPGASCSATVTFTPAALTAYTATFSFQPTAVSCAGCTYLAEQLGMSGTGVSATPLLTISPSPLDFGDQRPGSFTPLSVTLTNTSATEGVSPIGFVFLDPSVTAYGVDLSACTSVIPPGGSCLVTVSFKPAAVQAYTSPVSFNVVDASCLSCALPAQSFVVQGRGTAPTASLTPALMSFSGPVGSTTAAQTATLTNTGSATLNITSIQVVSVVAPDFKQQSTTCGSTLAPGASCTISVTYFADAASNQEGYVVVNDDAAGSPQSVGLTGVGIAPAPPVASWSPTTLTFTSTAGVYSAAQTATLTNSGGSTLNITQIQVLSSAGLSLSGAFVQKSTTCGATLGAGASCTVSVAFGPDRQASYTGQIVSVDNATSSPQSVNLTGTGSAPPPAMTLSPASLDFGPGATGIPFAPQYVTLTNSNSSLPISLSSITSSDPAFTVTVGTCGVAISLGASCKVPVTFTPSLSKSYSATISFQANSIACLCGYPVQTFTVTGSGTAPQISISSSTITFSTTAFTTSAAQTATISNSGSGPLLISGISLAGSNPNDYRESDNCGLNLAAGASCTISVTFTPPSLGSFPATVVINDNDPTSPQTITLSGTGVNTPDFVVASSIPSLAVPPGGSAQFSITVSAQNGASIPAVTVSASGLPPGATASFTQSSITPGSTSATTILTIHTRQTLAANKGSDLPPDWPTAALPALTFLGWFIVPRKQRRRWMTLGLLLFASLGGISALTGCAGGGFNLIPPAKTYTVTVNATVGAVQQTTTVQLTVE